MEGVDCVVWKLYIGITALLRVYNDIVTTIGKANGSYLVLLDLSAAFDTIDHEILFELLKK